MAGYIRRGVHTQDALVRIVSDIKDVGELWSDDSSLFAFQNILEHIILEKKYLLAFMEECGWEHFSH